jgi:hypothetical protein
MQLWFKSTFPIYSPSLSRSFFKTICRGVQMKVVVRGRSRQRGQQRHYWRPLRQPKVRTWLFGVDFSANFWCKRVGVRRIYIYHISYIYMWCHIYIYLFICVELNLSIVQEWNDYIRLDHEIRLDQIKCQLWMNHDLYKPWLMFFSGLLPKQWWLCQAGHKSLGVASQSPVARGLSSGNHHVHSHEIGTCLVYLIL